MEEAVRGERRDAAADRLERAGLVAHLVEQQGRRDDVGDEDRVPDTLDALQRDDAQRRLEQRERE